MSKQRYWWRVSLELRLRKCSGDAFQDFFANVMGKAHGPDYVRVRPFGVLGDKGCDGYRQSTGAVYQCYGALYGDIGKVAYLVSKMDEDFHKARKAIPEIMKEWHMVHNLVEGLPIDAIQKMDELKKANPTIKFGFFGYDSFEEEIFALPIDKIEDLLGPAATDDDTKNLQIAELKQLIAAVASAVDEAAFDVYAITPVSPDKLEYNELPNHWKRLIHTGWQNATFVDAYINRSPTPLIGEKIAKKFHERYLYLKGQSLSAGAMMSSLYEGIVGTIAVPPARAVAAQALLAYLFERCDIFENVPVPSEVAS